MLNADLVAEFHPTAVWLYDSVACSDESDRHIDEPVVLDSLAPPGASISRSDRSTRQPPVALRSTCRSPVQCAPPTEAETPTPSNGQPLSTAEAATNATDPVPQVSR